jgi:UDP-glucuronate decarboxylase
MSDFCLESDILEIVETTRDIHPLLSGKTIVVTGGMGFLGRYFCRVVEKLNESALEAPCKLTLLDNFISSDQNDDFIRDHDNVRFLRHDIIQPLDYDGPKPDYVVHAAGIASPFHYRAYPLETLDVSVIGSRNMLDLARRNGARFMFFSSSEIYGDPDAVHIPTPESYRGYVSCRGPRACYDESKRLGETLCYIYHTHLGIETNAVRPFNVYGPGMRENDYRVLPNFASRLKADQPLQLYGTGRQTRTYCYITDAINGFFRVMVSGAPGEVYNVGCDKPEISVHQLVEIIKKVYDGDVKYKLIEYPDSYPADEPQRRCPDIRKARLQLKYEPAVSVEDGLRRFLSWTKDNFVGEQ